MRAETTGGSLPSAGGKITRLACAELAATGIELQPLLRQAKLTLRQIEDQAARLSVQSQIRFLDLAADALHDDWLGFHLAQKFDLREVGLLHYVMASSQVLGDAFRRAVRYSTTINEGIVLRYREAQSVSILFEYAAVARHSDRHQIEFWVTALVRSCRQLTGRRVSPRRVQFIHRRPEDRSELDAFLGVNAEFGAPVDEILLPADIKDMPVVGADPYLNDLLVRFCEEALARRVSRSGPVRIRVENALAPLLPHGNARMSEIAGRLGMSQRTLARRLAEEGLTFADVLEQLRCDSALRHLEDPSLSMSQIAWLLGYQETSAFTHAFKRWTGRAPREMRTEAARAREEEATARVDRGR
jgi:AraC-like DNA-binding protein